jgi:hypothetical protein
MTWTKAERNEIKALRVLGYSGRADNGRVIGAGGAAAVSRLRREGLIESDPDWSGCTRLTPAGSERLAFVDDER